MLCSWLLREDGGHEQADAYSEIDIIENVSLLDRNEITMFTDRQCSMQDSKQTGLMRGLNCTLSPQKQAYDEKPNCGVQAPRGSFGEDFNKQGGGVWATQIEANGIKVWHFPRDKVPGDCRTEHPKPESWGAPVLNLGRRIAT